MLGSTSIVQKEDFGLSVSQEVTESTPGLLAHSSLKKGVYRMWCYESKLGLTQYVHALNAHEEMANVICFLMPLGRS